MIFQKTVSKKIVLGFIIYLLILASFVAKGVIALDSDFGWHIQMGKLISKGKIPVTDPFSYTMPSFPYIDHEWLTNLFMYRIFSVSGKFSLSLIAGLISVWSLNITMTSSPHLRAGFPLKEDDISAFNSSSRLNRGVFLNAVINNPLSRGVIKKNGVFLLVFYSLLLLGASSILRYSGIRPQIESWLFLAILLKLVMNEKAWGKWKYMIPPLFVLWVNVHASFVAGLAVLILVFTLRFFRTRRFKNELWVIGLSFFATLLNPYGIKVWSRVLGEMWLQASDPSLRWAINEWTPAFISLNLPLIVLIPFSFALLWRYRQRLFLEEIGTFMMFFILGMTSIRHVPLWIIVALPLVYLCIVYLYLDIKEVLNAKSKFKKAAKLIFIISLFVFILESFSEVNGARWASEENYYPAKAIEFLKSDLPEENIFSEYTWGGYLIWKLPEKKVFIDGRMPSWKRSGSSSGESEYALEDYRNIILGNINYEELFNKYKIHTVVYPRPDEVKPGTFNLIKRISKDGWELVYEDQVTVVYRKSEKSL